MKGWGKGTSVTFSSRLNDRICSLDLCQRLPPSRATTLLPRFRILFPIVLGEVTVLNFFGVFKVVQLTAAPSILSHLVGEVEHFEKFKSLQFFLVLNLLLDGESVEKRMLEDSNEEIAVVTRCLGLESNQLLFHHVETREDSLETIFVAFSLCHLALNVRAAVLHNLLQPLALLQF